MKRKRENNENDLNEKKKRKINNNLTDEEKKDIKNKKVWSYISLLTSLILYNEKNNNLLSIKYEAIVKELLEDDTEYWCGRRERVEKLKKKIFTKNISKW